MESGRSQSLDPELLRLAQNEEKADAPSWAGMSVITEVKTWTHENYTRVVVYLDEPIEFSAQELPADPAHKKPPRIYLDLRNARLAPSVPRELPIGDGLLQRARIGQFNKEKARLVLDLESLASHQVVPFRDPFRIVIDVRGERPEGERTERVAREPAEEGDELSGILGDDSTESTSPARNEKKGKQEVRIERPPERHTVVIDAGHGGKDPGAIGPDNLYEKTVVLGIAKQVAEQLRSRGHHVVLTREDDTFLKLEERTAIANSQDADLFVSIHANAAASPQAYGVETYHLAAATDDRAAEVAARENAISTEEVDALQELLSALKMSSRRSVSSVLARYVQGQISDGLARHYRPFRSIGVKGAPFYVLVGTEMAAILVETGFITNPTEAGRLGSEGYQEQLAASIVRGIEEYLKKSEKVPI